MRNYKFSFLGYFALNVALVIALLVIRGLDVDAPGLLGIIEHSIVFLGRQYGIVSVEQGV